MKGFNRMLKFCLFMVLTLIVLFDNKSLFAQFSSEKLASDFFKGKIITNIVPSKSGGGYDLYARMLAGFIEKHVGARVVVKNIAGGGGTIGINAMYRAKPDGLTIGNIMMAGALPAQLTGAQGVEYDLRKFTYLARLADDPHVFVVGRSSPFKTFKDILNAKEKIKLASTGTSGATYIGSLTLKLAFDLHTFDIITGYQGGQDCNLAVMRGDVVGMVGSVSGRLTNIRDGDLKPLVIIHNRRVRELPEVPTVFEFGLPPEKELILKAFTVMSDMARVLVSPPGLPKDRLMYLRSAVEKAMADPELIALAKKQGHPINYLPGLEVEKAIKQMIDSTPRQFIDELKKVM